MSNPLYKLDITEDYDDLPILHKKDEYLMQAFVAGGFRNAELKTLNFVRKSIQIVSLANIATVDRNRISYQSYEGVESNGLCKDLRWPKVLTKEEIHPSFIILWKSALNKFFINQTSRIDQRISTGLCLGNRVDQDVGDKWVW